MPLEKEIWINSLVGNLFADNTFLAKSLSLNECVTGKKCHIPNAGTPAKVKKNRSSVPAEVTRRTDSEATFDLSSFTTDPMLVQNVEDIQLSYNKRESCIAENRSKLEEAVAIDLLRSWAPDKTQAIETTGGNVLAHTPKATGNRKAMTKATVKAAMVAMNKQNVPKTGRYMILDSEMYSQLLDSLTEAEARAFHAQADVARGTVGKLYGFEFFERSEVLSYTTAKELNAEDAPGATTDLAAGLAWQENCVCRAIGETKAFEQDNAPTLYGDVFSFEVLAGGAKMRTDKKGVLLILQAAGL